MADDSLQQMLQKVEHAQKGAREARKKNEPVQLQSQQLEVVELEKYEQLPIWASTFRGVPNSILRSALFGATKRGKRAYFNAAKKASVDGITVVHTGPALDQADLDVWEQCLDLAKTGGLGVEIQFSDRAFLKAIGRSTGKSDREWLKDSFRRLMTSLVELEDGSKAYAGQLIHHWYRDENTGHQCMILNPKLASMFGVNTWTAISSEERKALKGQPIAQWLHGFYCTHADPFPYKVETIYKLCGSESKNIFHFKSNLKEALIYLEKSTNWSCTIDEFDLVQIKKPKKLKKIL